jgi:hypothetical protein
MTLTGRAHQVSRLKLDSPRTKIVTVGPQVATTITRCCRCNREILPGNRVYRYEGLSIGPACVSFVEDLGRDESDPDRIGELARENYRQYIRELTMSAMSAQGLL